MEIKKIIQNGIQDDIFPGAAVGIYLGSKEKDKERYYVAGHTSSSGENKEINRNTIFDLASLTKPLATTLAVLCLLKESKIDLKSSLHVLVGEKIPADKEAITIAMLLNHSAGFPAHREFFKIIKKQNKKDARSHMWEMVLGEPLLNRPGETQIYSDLGFLLLGWIVEKISGENLDSFVQRKLYAPLGLANHLFFSKGESENDQNTTFACCEYCQWRKRTLCGEVSDENCYALGGVAGHAGLFGDIVGVTGLVSHLLEQWKGRANSSTYDSGDLTQFLNRQQAEEKGTWALGFDTPSANGSSAGQRVSPKSIGHLGFTGTSFWIDPERDAAVVLLTNRVHPSRENEKIKEFRPYFHDAVWKFIDELN